MTNNKSAICIVTIEPHIEFVEFYNAFNSYDIFFMIDNNNFDCDKLKTRYPRLNFIQLSNNECENAGFKHSSYMPHSSLVFNEIISWDKAVYYFTSLNKSYDYVWFLEDDVFIYGEETIQNIDNKYSNSDILCRDKNPESKPDEWQWFWPAIHINFERPYFHSPICAVRMSKKLLESIYDYISLNKKLFFIEAMFPTIAHKNNLIYDTPDEFKKIVWRCDWKQSDLNKCDFVHPIKNFEMHKKFREVIYYQECENMSKK